MSDQPMTWAERIAAAVESHRRWKDLPIGARLDRVFKESGVRDLVAERDEARRDAEALEVALGWKNVEQMSQLAAAEAERDRWLQRIADAGCVGLGEGDCDCVVCAARAALKGGT